MLIPSLLLVWAMPRLSVPPDVPETEAAYAAVKLLDERGVLHTYNDGLYRGDRPVSRYELVWMADAAFRAMDLVDLSLKKVEVPPDVPDDLTDPKGYFPAGLHEAIRRMSGQRVLPVYADGLLRGARPASKDELAVVGYRVAKKTIKWNADEAAATAIPEPDGKPLDEKLLDPAELAAALHTLAAFKALPLMADGTYQGGRPASRYEAAIMFAALIQRSKP